MLINLAELQQSINPGHAVRVEFSRDAAVITFQDGNELRVTGEDLRAVRTAVGVPEDVEFPPAEPTPDVEAVADVDAFRDTAKDATHEESSSSGIHDKVMNTRRGIGAEAAPVTPPPSAETSSPVDPAAEDVPAIDAPVTATPGGVLPILSGRVPLLGGGTIMLPDAGIAVNLAHSLFVNFYEDSGGPGGVIASALHRDLNQRFSGVADSNAIRAAVGAPLVEA